jgi:aspartyl-tRNA(Asn)/glutamyl-tRNA(Gln) amidotransferase subunit A
MLGAMAGHDATDPSSRDVPVSDYPGALVGDLRGVRVGVDPLLGVAEECLDPAVRPALEAAGEVLTALGAEVRPVKLPLYEELSTATIVILVSEGAAFHMNDLRARWEDFGAGTRMVLGSAGMYSGADYVQAQRVRRVGLDAINRVFADVDLIVTPTAGIAAVPLDEIAETALGPKWPAIFTPYWNAVGLPAMTVPMGFNREGLPLGLQIAGPAFDEATVLRAGDAYQSLTEWHSRRPAFAGARAPASGERS